MKTKNDFEFKYTAPSIEERKEIESIRNSYVKNSTSNAKIETLRKLDNKVKGTPTCIALILGIVGTLIFGLGLTMILEWNIVIWALPVCLVGLVAIILAHPIYHKISIKLKDKYAEEIIKLSDELLNEKDEK